MSEIDFLPARYREQHSHRKARLLRIGVVLLFTGVLAAAGAGQWVQRRALEQQLSMVRQQYDSAQQASQELANLQGTLADLRSHAELHTYLRHPWPRTQILAAIVTELPESIALRQLQIIRELDEANRGAAARRENPETAEAAAAQLTPAQRDLEKLRAETDPARVVVVLHGVADEHTDLHAYLAELNASELFDEVVLESIESRDNQDKDDSIFQARLVVKPGIGQAGGPLRAEALVESLEYRTPATAVAARSNTHD